jgi:dihydroorotate dehydrogenase (fumarate)/dihydroorotate dehydrogenase
MGIYTSLVRPLLFRCDPEWIHDCTITATQIAGKITPLVTAIGSAFRWNDPRLETHICGIRFPNPIGLAAGYDKNGAAVNLLAALGFGHVEIGSISCDPSTGNPKPRLFRLPADEAIVVHYGLPNIGAEAVAARLRRIQLPVPLGINIVKTNRGLDAPPDSDQEILADYTRSVAILKDLGDYLCLNLSCPNTETGREFFSERQHVRRLLHALSELEIRCPLFLKVSPLGGISALEELLEAVNDVDIVSGFVFNLAPGKPSELHTPSHVWEHMPGAVSGKPVRRQLNDCIREMYRRMDRSRYSIIGSGGLFSAPDAYEKIRLGASLVQIYTALVYEGPGVVKKISRGLATLLERDGFASVAEAVGTDAVR